MSETIDYEGIKRAVALELYREDTSLRFLYKNDKPIIITSLGYDFVQYYVFIKGSDGIYIYGVERHLKKEGWHVYDEVVASFNQSEFEKIFGEIEVRE